MQRHDSRTLTDKFRNMSQMHWPQLSRHIALCFNLFRHIIHEANVKGSRNNATDPHQTSFGYDRCVLHPCSPNRCGLPSNARLPRPHSERMPTRRGLEQNMSRRWNIHQWHLRRLSQSTSKMLAGPSMAYTAYPRIDAGSEAFAISFVVFSLFSSDGPSDACTSSGTPGSFPTPGRTHWGHGIRSGIFIAAP